MAGGGGAEISHNGSRAPGSAADECATWHPTLSVGLRPGEGYVRNGSANDLGYSGKLNANVNSV